MAKRKGHRRRTTGREAMTQESYRSVGSGQDEKKQENISRA